MDVIVAFLLGVGVALLGVMPPGLVNMNAAKISITESRKKAIVFAMGAGVIIVIQISIAVVFARYLAKNPEVLNLLKRVALGIFILVTIYFFAQGNKEGKKKDKTIPETNNHFWQGMVISALNIFPIPYYAYMGLTLRGFGWLEFTKPNSIAYVGGVTFGSLIVFYVYIFFFNLVKSDKVKSKKGMNYIIGSLTAIVSIITLVNILRGR